ncbi:hypothetical protein [Mycolicibacterium vaccae]|uniref:hypothetical protein n=1 Tax=Mycolicibacterium vaccae TaxID=1810 RepID=UPI003CFC34A4
MAEFVATTRDPRVAAIHRRFDVPSRVTVCGRVGVGRSTVAAALVTAGVRVVTDGPADLSVVVVAERLKPEDAALLRRGPAVIVWNKADLAGVGPGGPLAVAARRAAEAGAATGCAAVPMVALLATVTWDESLLAALRVLAEHPADMTSVDAFVAGAHPLDAEVRAGLLAGLDRFGLAHAVLAVADGTPGAVVADRLRDLSGVRAAADAIHAATAPARYRSVCAALRELRLVAAGGDRRIEEFLTGDAVVLAVMAAAVDVVEGAGLRVDRGDDTAAHLRRAVHWERYARGPVDALHASCGAAIRRGSLRLLASAP